jgi:hypothetical protein
VFKHIKERLTLVQRFVLLRQLAIKEPIKCDDHPLKGIVGAVVIFDHGRKFGILQIRIGIRQISGSTHNPLSVNKLKKNSHNCGSGALAELFFIPNVF